MAKRKRRKRRNIPLKKMQLVKFFIAVVSASVIFAVIAVGTVLYFYRAGSGNVEIIIDVLEEEIIRGVPFNVEVGVINNTAGLINSTSITLRLDEGLVHLASGAESGTLKEDTGDIGSGSLAKRTFKVLPIGEVGVDYELQAEFSYSFGRTSFQEIKKDSVIILDDSVRLSIEVPEQIVGGSFVDLQIGYENVGSLDLNNVKLELDYPSSFSFISASIEPDSLNNLWDLGSLMSGSEGFVIVSGVVASESGTFDIRGTLKADFIGEQVVVANKETTLNVLSSPLGIDAKVFGIPQAGEKIRYVISYSNKSGIDLNDVTITAEPISELFDFTTLKAETVFNPALNKIVWDKRTTPELSLVNSGAGGNIEMEISLLPSFPIARISDKDFVLKLHVEIESPSVPFYLDAESLVAKFALETKVSGLIEVESKAFYRDALSGIINSGSLPPAVGKSTHYTIHWTLRNHATNVRNVEVRAVLPKGVSWVDTISSNWDSSPSYESESKEIVWKISEIPAAKGVISKPIHAVFQIEATPDASIVGQFQPLLARTIVTATDNWSGYSLTNTSLPLDTRLPHDPTVGEKDGIVIK